MRHRVGGRRLSRPTDHRLSLYRNLMRELIEHGGITTTEAKAKEVRGMVEKLVTLGKANTLHARRQVIATLGDTKVAGKVVEVLAPRFRERPGGYTRVLKLGPRHGDGAPMARLEFVE